MLEIPAGGGWGGFFSLKFGLRTQPPGCVLLLNAENTRWRQLVRVLCSEYCLVHPAAGVFLLLNAGNTHWRRLGWVLFSEIWLLHPVRWVRFAVKYWKYPLASACVGTLFQKHKKEADASYRPLRQTKNLTLGGRYLTHQPLCNPCSVLFNMLSSLADNCSYMFISKRIKNRFSFPPALYQAILLQDL